MDSLIGQPISRTEDHRLLTGTGRFIDDINLAGQAYVAFLRSTHAHARITRLDIATAKSAPGAITVLILADYTEDGLGALPHFPIGADHLDPAKPSFSGDEVRYDPMVEQFPLAGDRVRHVGEIIAMVVADSQAEAQDAVERIEIDYDPLPVVTDARAALEPDAPRLWEGGNCCIEATNGDRKQVEEALAAAAHVVRFSALNHRVSGMPLEPRGVIGDFDPSSGKYTLYAPTQGVHRHKSALMMLFGATGDEMRVVTNDVGGGFGVRSSSYVEYVLLVWASRRIERPAKWTAGRAEAFLADYQARDVFGDGAMAFDESGQILTIQLDYICNLGAYPVTFAVMTNLLRMAGGPYDVPAMHVAVRGVFSNTIPTAVYRGAGRPEVTYLVERMIDLAADDLGLDRAELRRRNMITPSALPFQSALGHLYESGAFPDNLEAALDKIGWDGFASRREDAAKRGKLAGIGIANYLESPTGAPNERADITLLAGETIQAVVGTQASGQGHETSFAQVVASIFDLPLDHVSILFGDSDVAVSGGGTHADRSMRLAGTVLVRAAEDIIEQGRKLAADKLEVAPSDLIYENARFKVVGTDRSIGLFELPGPLTAGNEVTQRLHAHPNGVAVCEVEIDPDTGAIDLVRYGTVDDVGRVINPMIVDGQVHGGIAQGVGQALMEQCVFDSETGQFVTGSFMDYAMPRADDFPSFDVTQNGLPAPSNPLGVKGAGECGTTPATAAIVGAVVDALRNYGVRHIEMPLTPEKIWRVVHDAE
jgi:aerobic carbon-monoxide dehydrogenase large subunit